MTAGRATRLAAIAATAVLGFAVARLAWSKIFSIDEFEYAHAAWLVSRGLSPYRDFFEHHFPLVFELLSGFFRLGTGGPGVLALRMALLPFLALAAGSAAVLNRGQGARVTAVAFLAAVAILPAFVEIRPDPVAFALFLASLAVLQLSGTRPAARCAVSGVLLALAIWSSQKVLVYGAVVAPAVLSDLVRLRLRRTDRLFFARPLAFLSGFSATAAVLVSTLLATSSLGSWFRCTIRWSVEHERGFAGFPWTRYFSLFARDGRWLIVVAAIGVYVTLRRILASGRSAPGTDILLAAGLVTSLLSFAVQKAAYPYSLVPFAGLLALFAARGAAAVAGAIRRTTDPTLRRAVGVVAAAAVAWALLAVFTDLDRLRRYGNSYQISVLRKVDELTGPEDPVYDNSGSAVDRPSVSYFFFTSGFLRQQLWSFLSAEMPAAIRRSGCPAMLRDVRFDWLPDPLKDFLATNYQPYGPDVWLWGRRYVKPPGKPIVSDFYAVRTSEYFAAPQVEDGSLLIDGEPVRTPTFRLSAGNHRIVYSGFAAEIYLLWLPRNGERYQPKPGLRPRFSILF